MPVVQLPISKGLVTDSSEADWLDSLPVNMVAVPKSVLNAKGLHAKLAWTHIP